jgi:hypothetical protein
MNNLQVNNVIASIILYNKDIDYQKSLILIDKMIKDTSFLINKKYIVINLGINYSIKPKITINNSYFKVIEMNLFSFTNKMSMSKYYKDIINKVSWNVRVNDEISKNKKDLLNKKINKVLDTPSLLNSFNSLFKLNIINLFENEDLNSINIDYNLIFIFEFM